MSQPVASVVIPSARGARLAFALEALAQQTLPSERFEVIVVRDRSAPPPPPMPEGIPARVILAERSRNIAALRNVGWRAATAPLIAFTDDDCRPAPQWLERLLAAAADATIVQGRTEPDPDEAHLLHGLARSQRISGPSGFFQTCNLIVPRRVLEEAAGFDERFAALGEDTDLAYRAIEAGAEGGFAADALVWHAVIPRTLPAAVREAVRRDTIPALVARHPSVREGLYRRIFWKRPHALLLLAASGLLIRRRRPALALALAIPYVNGVPGSGQRYGPRGLLRRLLRAPSKLVVDSTELAVTVRAAIRERTLVL